MRYLVRERIFSIGNDFWIEDEQRNRPFYVDGKALSLREACELRDANGNLLTRIHKKLLAIRDTMTIEGADGQDLAKVRPAFFSPIRHRYEVDLADGQRLEALGSFTDKNWELTSADGQVVGRVSRHWFRIRDTYGVEVAPGVSDPLVISIAVCIDHIHEDKVREHEQHDH
ncbi:MAG: LURP-one-related family protein [Nocardiopsaceae bacterium]|nr:LURP-one-related family protein [Nocardiopsaceae bacterium]